MSGGGIAAAVLVPIVLLVALYMAIRRYRLERAPPRARACVCVCV